MLFRSASRSVPPPSVLPDISPARGEIGPSSAPKPITNATKLVLRRHRINAGGGGETNLPPCGGDVRQDRGGCEGVPGLKYKATFTVVQAIRSAGHPRHHSPRLRRFDHNARRDRRAARPPDPQRHPQAPRQCAEPRTGAQLSRAPGAEMGSSSSTWQLPHFVRPLAPAHSVPPPSGLPAISPTRGGSAVIGAAANGLRLELKWPVSITAVDEKHRGWHRPWRRRLRWWRAGCDAAPPVSCRSARSLLFQSVRGSRGGCCCAPSAPRRGRR